MLTLVANDLIPTTDLEIYMSTLLVFTGTICIGIMIGEIASVLSEMTKRNRIATEDYDNLLSFLTGLKISASVQDWVSEYLHFLDKTQFIKDDIFYNYVSKK